MMSWIIEHEMGVRLSFFFGVFSIMAFWEWIIPRRQLQFSKPIRWIGNIGIMVLNSLLIRGLFPILGTGLALIAQSKGWGLFNILELPLWIKMLLSLLLLDFIIYLQHVMFHTLPLLWRFHRMHHADLDLDVTSGTRFHPVEIIISMGIKFTAICLIGPPVVMVVVFEVILNAAAMFNHANVYLPQQLDRILRWFVVTPDMHRVHHSDLFNENNTNFGFNVPWWDRVFGTYCAQPSKGHLSMTIGLKKFRTSSDLYLHRLLIQPLFSSKKRFK